MGVVLTAKVLDAPAWVFGPGDAGADPGGRRSWWSVQWSWWPVRPPWAPPPRLR